MPILCSPPHRKDKYSVPIRRTSQPQRKDTYPVPIRRTTGHHRKVKSPNEVRLNWTFTVKFRKRASCTRENYEKLLSDWKYLNVCVTDLAWEHDKQKRLHIHGIAQIPIGISYSTQLVSTELHTKQFKRLLTEPQRTGWYKYMDKQFEDCYDDVSSEHEPTPKKNLFKDTFRSQFTDDEWTQYLDWCEIQDNFRRDINSFTIPKEN